MEQVLDNTACQNADIYYGSSGKFNVVFLEGKVLGVFQIACLCTFVQKYEAAISDAGSVTIW